jgi:hypothetical protein
MVTAREWRVTVLADGRYRVENGDRVLVADAVRDGGASGSGWTAIFDIARHPRTRTAR